MPPKFFKDQAELRKWFAKNHQDERELWLGFYKVGSGKPSVTWSQSVDEAICVGWIDGIRKTIDDHSYMIRFTPRKPKSIWSDINIDKVKELTKRHLMQPAGIAAFKKREDAKSRVYSFEQKEISLDKIFEKIFRSNKKAWNYFTSAAPSYRKAATWWVMSAKQEETKLKRLGTLMKDSEDGKYIKQMMRPGNKGK